MDCIVAAMSTDSTFNILSDLNWYCNRQEQIDFPSIDVWLDYYERENIELEWIFDLIGRVGTSVNTDVR
jgi:hypothetical protein